MPVLSPPVSAADSNASRAQHSGRIDRGGVIYAMTNASTGNEILVFGRDSKGRLQGIPAGNRVHQRTGR